MMIRYFHQSLDDSVGAAIGVGDGVSEGEADDDEFAELTLPLVLPNTFELVLPLPFEFTLPFVIGFALAFVFALAGVFKFVLSDGFEFIFPLELSGGPIGAIRTRLVALVATISMPRSPSKPISTKAVYAPGAAYV